MNKLRCGWVHLLIVLVVSVTVVVCLVHSLTVMSFRPVLMLIMIVLLLVLLMLPLFAIMIATLWMLS